jgi:hypothetical protein
MACDLDLLDIGKDMRAKAEILDESDQVGSVQNEQ